MYCKTCGNQMNDNQTICPSCGADIGEEQVCDDCGNNDDLNPESVSAETVSQDAAENTISEDNSEQKVSANEEISATDSAEPTKKKKTSKIVALCIVVAVILVAAAVSVFLFFGSKDKEEGFVERALYFKDNSIYYLEPKNNKPVLITDNFFKEQDSMASDLIIMNAVEFTQKGDKVFFAQKVDLETEAFALYYRLLDKPESEPVKLAEDVESFVVDNTGEKVIYLDIYGNMYSHNLQERAKIISEAENMWVSKDCTQVLYLLDDGGLYIQTVDGEKDKIDSDVTRVYKTGDNFESIYYFKDKELYVKKAESEKVKVGADILDVVLICEDGGVYYTKENEIKGSGTLMDYIVDPDGLAEKDEELADNYYYHDYKARNEALNRIWTREVLEKTEIQTVDSLYYFNGETSDLVNDSFVESRAVSEEAGALIIKSFDNININKVSITDFVNELNKKEKFRERIENGETIYKSDFQEYDYFDEFSKMILGAMRSDATTYVVKDGKLIEIKTDSASTCFAINESADTVYYIDKFDDEKGFGELRTVKIADGAVISNEPYDSDVCSAKLISDNKIIYFKDVKDEKGDLYLNKQLIEYDVSGNYFISDDGEDIFYITDYNDNEQVGTLNVYSNGEKKKIAENVSDASALENGNVLYFQNYSEKSEKGDLYIHTADGDVRIDYDVQEIYKTTDRYRYNFVFATKNFGDLFDFD